MTDEILSPNEYKKKSAKQNSKSVNKKRKEIFDKFVKKRRINIGIIYAVLFGLLFIADLSYDSSRTDNSLWGFLISFILGAGTVIFLGPIISYGRGDVEWKDKLWMNIGLAITGFGLIFVIYWASTIKEEVLINNFFKDKKNLK